MIFAATKSGALFAGDGHSSTTSKPTTFLFLVTSLRKCISSKYSGPPGSGVPVDGISEGSKTSRSIVI